MTGFIISLIISTILAVDQTVAMGLANNRNSEITKRANEMYNMISKDRTLLNQLYEAYQRRDAALATNLINSSPFGTRIRTLRKSFKDNIKDMSDTSRKLSELEHQQQVVQSSASDAQVKSTSTGSAIGDLISGAAKDQTSNIKTPQLSGTTERTIKEVNYGQK